MATQIIFKNVQSNLGIITIKAAVKTVNDLFNFLKECYQKYGLSLRFLKEFLCTYFPQLMKCFLSHFVDELKKTVISWLSRFLNLFN